MSSRNREAYEKLLGVIQQVVTQKNLQKPLSLYLGKRERYFTNLFSAKNNIALAQLFDIAEFCKVPAAWFVAKAVPQPSLLPEDQLLFEHQDAGLPADTFLDGMALRISALDALAVEKKNGLSCHRPVFEALEEERFTDRHAAQRKTEALAERLLADLLEARPGPLPARRLAELGASLSLWAAIQRSHGLRDLAVKAFLIAFPLVRRSGDPWAQGICFQRASHVLRDFDRPDLAMDFIQEALCQFVAAESWLDVWRTYVDRGTHFSSFPKFSESNSAYELALSRLPSTDWRYRAGALQGLATNAHRQGKLPEARELIARGIGECSAPNHITAFLRWREAAILFELGDQESGIAAFPDALGLLGRFASAGDIALASLDYAEVLLRSERFSHFSALVREVTQWLPALRPNPILHRVLMNFIDLARFGDLSLEDVELARLKVRDKSQGEVIG